VADILPTIALIMSAYLETQQKVSWLEEIELNFDASFQQILRSELEILWEARSTPTLTSNLFQTKTINTRLPIGTRQKNLCIILDLDRCSEVTRSWSMQCSAINRDVIEPSKNAFVHRAEKGKNQSIRLALMHKITTSITDTVHIRRWDGISGFLSPSSTHPPFLVTQGKKYLSFTKNVSTWWLP
jgi:hypothetical protein